MSAASGAPVEVDVGGVAVRLSSLGRVIWPATGTTKADLVRYYAAVAPVLLPHLADRPVTLHRFPEGIGGPHFYQTRTPPHPQWLRTVTLQFASTGKTFETPVLDSTASLVWAANIAAVELHPFLARTTSLDRPEQLVVDLDPGPPAGLLDAAALALVVRDRLAVDGLTSFAKVSGGAGVHVHVPLDRTATYADTKGYARRLARTLATAAPERVVATMTKAVRRGRVLIDWSQNDAGKSTVAPYSLRGLNVPTVAAPVTWDELAAAVAADDAQRLVFSPRRVLDRVERDGDLMAAAAAMAQPLPTAATTSAG